MEKEEPDAVQLAIQLLKWVDTSSDLQRTVEALTSLPVNTLASVQSLVGVASLKEAFGLWLENRKGHSESYWQGVLAHHSYVLSQIFSQPVVVLEREAYVGGKRAANTHGNLVDFLCASVFGRSAILVEIKTPETRLLGSEYRLGVYPPSRELSGAIQQAAVYKQTLTEEARVILQETELRAFDPRPIVIIGTLEEFGENADMYRSFEIFRRQQRDVEVVTFDELFGKVERLIGLLEGGDP